LPAVGNATYDPVKGFSPITYLFNSVVVLTVPHDSPAKTMKELHEWGRKKPGGLTFGTPGLGSPSHAADALEMGADTADIGLTIHPHPTLSETMCFAAEMAEGSITDLYLPRK